MKASESWRRQDLTPEARECLEQLMHVRRYFPEDHVRGEALLDAFLETLTEPQLTVFARLLRELTEHLH